MAYYKLPEEERGEPCQDFRGPHDTKAVMNCGTGSGLTLPTDFGRGRGGHQASFVAGTVSLNSKGLTCPTVKVDFSSMINYKAESRDGEFFIRLIFQLSRACDGGNKVALGTWVYEKEVDIDRRRRIVADGGAPAPVGAPQFGAGNAGRHQDIEMDFKEAFGFTWCECCNCPDCCLYIVEVVDIDTDNIRCLSLTNVGINALAI